MAASHAIRALAFDWESGDVIRTPSTIGKVEREAQAAIACDWFQATMPSAIRNTVVKQLASVFGAAEARSDIPKEMRSYRACLQFSEGARLYHSSRYHETCCLVISGKAKPTEHFCLLKTLFALGVKVTRMDLAFDDRRGVLSLTSVCEAVDAGMTVSRWKGARSQANTSLSSGAQRGRSIQFGSKYSASYLVAYDKGLETGEAEEGEWLRWELRLADSEATKFSAAFLADASTSADPIARGYPKEAKVTPCLLCYDASDMPVLDSDISPDLVERFGRLALHELKSRLSFRERATTSNVSRAKQLPWWESFLEYFEPLSNEALLQVCEEPEEGQSLSDKKRVRENAVRWQAEEILTEVYEEHIRSHASSRLEELLRSIPEYGHPAPRSGAEGVDEIALAFVGLHPSHETMVIPFPVLNQGTSKQTSKELQPRLAEVVSLPVRRSVSDGHDG